MSRTWQSPHQSPPKSRMMRLCSLAGLGDGGGDVGFGVGGGGVDVLVDEG